MKKWMRLLAAVAVLSMVAAACGGDDGDDAGGDTGEPTGATATGATATGPTATGGLPGEGYHGCYASDTGGVDDRSFNQKIHEGMLQAESELGIEYTFVESQSEADYAPFLQEFVSQDCDLIVPAGFNFGPTTVESAEANPDQLYAIVDYDIFDFSADPPEDVVLDNVRELTYQTDQAAFLAGYLAAGMSETGVVATYGGVFFPTVTIFMNGFTAGVRLYNQDNGTDVQVLGWDPEANDGAGDGTQISTDPAVGFDNSAEGRRVTEDFIAEGADVILPVAGPTGLGTVAAAEDAGDVSVIWVDDDGCVAIPDSCGVFLTSVLKNMNVSVFETMQSVIDGTFTGGLFVGTLENNGVGIAEYHEFDAAIPQELKDRIEELRAGVIDGSVSVSPADYPA
jgi:basic membrane protein A and related proteins